MLRKVFGKRRWVTSLAAVVLTAGVLTATVGAVSANGGGGWFRRGGGNHDTLLAEELGITEEELQSAQESARDKGMQQALEKGTITEEQYDNYQTQQALREAIDQQALMAEALGITVDELDDQTLSEWLDELGLDRETFQAQLKSAHDAAIEQAVADGVITQEQADALPDQGMRGGRGNMDKRSGQMPEGMDGMRGSRRQAPQNDGTLKDSGFGGRGVITPSEA